MFVTVSPSPFFCPPGRYKARLTTIKPLPPMRLPDGKVGDPLFAWEFEVCDGPQAGRRPSALTPQAATVRNGLGRLLRSILGRPIDPAECIDLATFVGRDFAIEVAFNAAGLKTRVVSASLVGRAA